MAAAAKPETHPSEGRRQTKLWRLLYGLIAPPSAWIAAQIFCSTLANQACHPKYEPLSSPAISGGPLAHGLALGLAALVCVSGVLVAHEAWRGTRAEHRGGSQTLLEVGEGRSRFMALVGLLTSLGFLVAVGFSIPAAVFVPLC